MEDQTHLTLGKMNKSSSLPPWRPDTLGKKTRGEKKKEEEKNLAASHPSVKGRRPQEHGQACTLAIRGDTRCPLSFFGVGPQYWLLAFWL